MTEVWGYDTGNGMTVVSASYDRYGGTDVGSSRFCKISIRRFGGGQVSAVNDTGPTGGLLTAGEQCSAGPCTRLRKRGAERGKLALFPMQGLGSYGGKPYCHLLPGESVHHQYFRI